MGEPTAPPLGERTERAAPRLLAAMASALAAALVGERGVGRALRSRNYRIYAAGNAVSLVGSWVQRIAVGWLAWELTGSPAWLGAVAFADLAPAVVVGPFAGVLADRVDRLRMLVVTQALAMAQALALAVLMVGGWLGAELLFALTLFLGVVTGFSQPPRLALIPSLVERAELSAAIAFNSVLFNGARFVGPVAAGAILLWGGAAAAFAVNGASYLALLLALARLRLAPESGPAAGKGVVADLVDAVRYALGHPGLGPLLGLFAVTSLFARPFTELLPGFAAEVFERGVGGLAWLAAATGIGALLGAAWLARRLPLTGLTGISVTSTLVFGLALLAFTASGRFWLAVPTVAVAGFAMAGSAVATQTLIQAAVEGAMRGRVLGLYGLILRGGTALGALAMGALATLWGLAPPLAAGALLCLGAWLWALPRRHRIEAALEVD